MSSSVANALFKTLEAAGYSVELGSFIDRTGDGSVQIDVTCRTSRERWIVRAQTEYDALIEALLQIGFDLEE